MKRIPIIIILLFIQYNSLAQAPTSLAFPSPNNKFLGNVNSGTAKVSVDLYTGTALVNIPICKLSSKDLSIPVSLNYTGGRGIKVQDYATMVGLGWQLNAGGSISRVVRGFPDEQPNGYLGTGLWGQKVANSENNGDPLPSQITGGTGFSLPTADGEPDLYYVKTPFFAFQFTFDENGNAVVSNNTGLKIKAENFYNSYSYIYNNSSFKVIDAQGNQYFFGSSSNSKEKVTSKLFGTDYTFPTTWYLDKIVSYNLKDSILFEYTSPTSDDVNLHYRKVTSMDGSQLHTDSTPIKHTIINPTVVSRIVSPLGEIEFTYATDRLDDPNAPRLSKVILKAYNVSSGLNETIKKYNFKYSYFGAPSTDPNQLRLKLDSITMSGSAPNSQDITSHSFIYNMDVNLPSRKNLYMIDYFGYYSSLLFIGPLSNPYWKPIKPETTHAKANILTGIKTLQGAKYHISYELNTYDSSGHNTAVGGLRVNKLSKTEPQGEIMYRVYKYNDNNGHSTGEILSDSYMESTWYGKCGIMKIFSESTSNFYDLNGNYVGYSSVKILEKNGGYQVVDFSNFSTPGCNDILNYTNVGSYSYPIPNVTTSISATYKRGLPLKKTVYDASDNIISEDKFTYTSLTDPIIRSSWGYHWTKISFSLPHHSCSMKTGSKYWTKVENYRLTQTIHKDYDQNNPTNFIQTTTNYTYAPDKRKIRSISTTNSKGNTHTQTFYYADDNNIPMTTTAEQTALNAMINENCTDALVHKIDNKNGAIHQIHHSYFTQPYGYNHRIYLANTQHYTENTLVDQQFFNYNASGSQLISSHKSNGMPTSTLYGYHAALPIARVRNALNIKKSSNGVTNKKKTLYLEPNYGGSISTEFTTAASGTITVTIPPGTYLGSNGGNGVKCYFSVSLYGPESNSSSLCISSAGTGDCTAPNSVSFPNMSAGSYTLSIYPAINTSTTNVPIDYTYPSPVINTIDSTEFFYEGFEEYPYASYGNAHTGKAYWDRSGSYQIHYTPTNNRDYVIQWWSRLNGKWKMNEQSYTGSMAISGTVDDIRIFPSDAQMTTYTYDPLRGKTGKIDPSGNTTTYEYDGWGRLVAKRDGDGDILSKTCYHLPGQPGGCKLYYNQKYTETFTKNDCAVGYGGSDIVYTVPAHTYVSSISQQDANNQARADANANGQAYANTHGSCTANNLYVYKVSGSSDIRPFHITIYDNNSQIIWEKTQNRQSTDLPISVNIPNGSYKVNIEAFNPITATVNGTTKTLQGPPESWQNISTPITIKLNY